MAVETLKNNEIGVYISTDLVTPAYKEVVCGTDITVDSSKDINKKKSKCGTHTAVSEPEYTVSFGGVANLTPTALTEISAQELAVIDQSTTPVLVKVEHRTDPTKYHRSGQGYISSYTENLALDDTMDFDIEFAVDGDLDLTS